MRRFYYEMQRTSLRRLHVRQHLRRLFTSIFSAAAREALTGKEALEVARAATFARVTRPSCASHARALPRGIYELFKRGVAAHVAPHFFFDLRDSAGRRPLIDIARHAGQRREVESQEKR